MARHFIVVFVRRVIGVYSFQKLLSRLGYLWWEPSDMGMVLEGYSYQYSPGDSNKFLLTLSEMYSSG